MVPPATKQNPDPERLDGQPKGSNGNGDTFGKFKHWGKTWKVNYDTHYFPLRLAYNAATKGIDPFEEGLTNRDKNIKLELISDIKRLQIEQQNNNVSYLNIYLDEA